MAKMFVFFTGIPPEEFICAGSAHLRCAYWYQALYLMLVQRCLIELIYMVLTKLSIRLFLFNGHYSLEREI